MQSWGLTDKGCIRKMNQDAYEIRQLDKNTLLCVVCDGMGGAKSGNVASSLQWMYSAMKSSAPGPPPWSGTRRTR